MSKPKKKNSNYNYRKQVELAEEKKRQQEETKSQARKYVLTNVIGYIVLFIAVILAIMKFTGDAQFEHAENFYVPLAGLAVIFICYENPKFKPWVKSVFTILGVIEILYGLFLIYQNAK